MDISLSKNNFTKKHIYKLNKNTFNQQLVIAGLLSISTFTFQNQAVATDYTSRLISKANSTLNLNNGDNVIANNVIGTTKVAIGDPGLGHNYNNIILNLANNVNIISDLNLKSIYSNEGIYLGGANSTITANALTISVKGGINARGLYIERQSTADLGTGSSISVTGAQAARAISISGASTLKANTIEINTDYTVTNSIYAAVDVQDYGSFVDLGTGSSITTNGRGASAVSVFGSNGIAANGPAVFSATNLSIITNGNMSYGIDANDASTIHLGSGSSIVTHGTDSNGIIMYDTIVNADALTVTTTGGGNAIGLEALTTAKVNIGAGSHISSAQAGALVASGDSSVINFLGTESNHNTIFSGGSYGASAQASGSVVNLANTDITIDRNGGSGLWAMGSGIITGENLTINGAAGSRGVYAMTNSQIDLAGNTVIKMADSTGMAIATENTAGYAASRINVSGQIYIQGGILSSGGIINVDMTSGSILTGATSIDAVNGSMLNMTMADTRWNMIADSSVTKLILNSSTIDFSEDKTGSVLTVDDLSGNGTFIMRTDIVGDGDGLNNSGDKLVVTGTSTGNHFLKILNQGSLNTTGNEVLTVVETADGQAHFGLDSSTPKVELGGYVYDVRQNGNNWELYSLDLYVPASPSVPVDPVNPVDPVTPTPDGGGQISTAADAGANFLNIGYLMNYADTQTLLQRMGDLRQNSSHGNMWIRGFAGKFDSFSGGKLSRFDMDYQGMQIGADKRISVEMPLFIGGYLGTTTGDSNYASGDGTAKASNVGLYTAYMADNGVYLDAIAKYSNIKNNFNVRDTQNEQVRGNGNSNGVSLSLEAGQKFNLTKEDNGFYIEPQAQFSYSHQNAIDINASNGLKVNLGSYESILGRANALLGYELNQGDNKINIYLKTGIVREFKGDVNYQLNGSTENHTFKGNWWNNGVGVSAQIAKQHTFYLDVDSSTGNKFDQRQINGGYRFSF